MTKIDLLKEKESLSKKIEECNQIISVKNNEIVEIKKQLLKEYETRRELLKSITFDEDTQKEVDAHINYINTQIYSLQKQIREAENFIYC